MSLLSAARSSWLKSFYAQTAEQLQRHHQALLFHPRTINPDAPTSHTPETEALLRQTISVPAHTELMRAVLDRDTEAARMLLRRHVEITLAVYRSIVGASVKEKNVKREEQVT